MVEESQLPVKQTLVELQASRSSFYERYRPYRGKGVWWFCRTEARCKAVLEQNTGAGKGTYRSDNVRAPKQSPRLLACIITNEQGYCILGRTVYRILKGY